MLTICQQIKKLFKSQIFEVIQLGAYLPVLISNLGKAMDKEAIIDLAIPLAKDILPTLVNNIASNAVLNVINKFGRKISGKEVVRA